MTVGSSNLTALFVNFSLSLIMNLISDVLQLLYKKYQHHLISSGDILLDFDIAVFVICVLLIAGGLIGSYFAKKSHYD